MRLKKRKKHCNNTILDQNVAEQLKRDANITKRQGACEQKDIVLCPLCELTSPAVTAAAGSWIQIAKTCVARRSLLQSENHWDACCFISHKVKGEWLQLSSVSQGAGAVPTYLLPDVVVAEEAAHLPLSEGPAWEGVIVPRQQVHPQLLNITAIQSSGGAERERERQWGSAFTLCSWYGCLNSVTSCFYMQIRTVTNMSLISPNEYLERPKLGKTQNLWTNPVIKYNLLWKERGL